FSVVSSQNTVVFKNKLTSGGNWDASNENTLIADFSSFKNPGEYKIQVQGSSDSYPFEIKSHVHNDLARASIKAFYFNRASMAIEQQYGDKWSRPMGHPDNQVVIHGSAASSNRPAGTKISSPGGWYDAGDYGKYIVNSGITTYTLFAAYQAFPSYYDTLKLNIPESSNSIPDLIDEILYNLRWMLTMQDPDDGGVYHKLTTAQFSGFVMPDKDVATRYIVQKSTTATLDFAAVTAQASRILRKFESKIPGLADSCLNASLKAWAWARKNPSVVYDQAAMNKNFSPSIATGEYGNRSPFNDELHWAGVELYLATRIDSFYTVATSNTIAYGIPSWGDVATLGLYSLFLTPDSLTKLVSESTIKTKIDNLAKVYLARYTSHPYKATMNSKDFYWGSNSVAANQGIALIMGYLGSNNQEYKDAALGALDYLLGKNPTNYCYITNMGDKPVMFPHHRPSGADGIKEPVPGFLSGGPNPGQEELNDCTKDCIQYPSKLAALSFVDLEESYASNEIAINWNAPLVFLTGAAEALDGVVPSSVRKNGKTVAQHGLVPVITSLKNGYRIKLPAGWHSGIVSITDLKGKVLQKVAVTAEGIATIDSQWSNQVVFVVIDAVKSSGERQQVITRLGVNLH
ncbi:MAG: endoglucanase, partial [Fibrobacter sp.]|nr:endoglucanase [Fibrobacter sp.]